MKASGWSITRILKCLLICMLSLQLFVVGFFFVLEEGMKSYVPLEKMSVSSSSDVILISVKNVEMVDRHIFLKIYGIPGDPDTSRGDTIINTKVVCKGRVAFQNLEKMDVSYTRSRAVVSLVRNVTAHNCEVEIFLDPKHFSKLVDGRVLVVRSAWGEVFGVDLRDFPVLFGCLAIILYIFAWYIGFNSGLPLIIGGGVTLALCILYFFLERSKV